MATTSSKITKCLITCYFGPLPEWMGHYQPPAGYDFILVTDLEDFNQRVSDILGIESTVTTGTGKPWDYRVALGLLYADKLKGYDFWGITDLDCVYGDVDAFIKDELLNKLHVLSNHHSYVCGCWTLFRNVPEVNELFMRCDWKRYMLDPRPNGWVEDEFSRCLESSGLSYAYKFWQGDPHFHELERKDGKLYQKGREIMMHHFRHSKSWPQVLTK